MKILIERLRRYSEGLVAYKLGSDFADAVYSAADMLENHASDRAALVAEIEKLRMALASACKERDESRKELHEAKSELAAMRNELCYLCGKYLEAHNGACDGCRWKKEA